MPDQQASPRAPAMIALAVFPLATLLLHLAFVRGYGYFRDELYYLACADHLAWGYVDHPPLSVGLLWIVKQTLGDSLLAIRLLPALAGALSVLLTGLIARELGGGRYAQALAMACSLIAPQYLALDSFYSMNAFDVLIWAASGYVLALLFKQDRLSLWLVLGGIVGLGLLNKISVLWLGFGLAAGLLLARRELLRRPGPWLAAGMAALLFLPHVVWQVREEKGKLGIFASNYGEAGAIDVLGRRYGLPRAISGHNNYWLWGPRGHSGELMIMLVPASSRSRLEERFQSVEQVGSVECGHCMPYENHRPVYLCRRPSASLAELWPRLKHYD